MRCNAIFRKKLKPVWCSEPSCASAGVRAIERSIDRAIDRAIERSSDRSIERSSERSSDRSSDRAIARVKHLAMCQFVCSAMHTVLWLSCSIIVIFPSAKTICCMYSIVRIETNGSYWLRHWYWRNQPIQEAIFLYFYKVRERRWAHEENSPWRKTCFLKTHTKTH